MHGTLEVPIKAYLHPRHQHCTDEAQKAETVLSVSYIYIYCIERSSSSNHTIILV